MAKRRVAAGRAWAIRDVSPEDLPDLLTAPPRASLAWVDDESAIRLAPVHARFDGSTWQVGRAGTDPDLDGREVVLVVDDGPGWFELRSVTVRGTASAEPPTVPRRWSIRPRRIVAWDYGSLRLTEGNGTGGPLGPPPPEPPENVPTPVQLPPEAARVTTRRARVLLLATASARSRPFCVPEWFLHHRGTFVMSTGAGSWSARNAAANPQVQLLIGGEDRPSEPRVRIIGRVVCRRTLPPAAALVRLALRYYLTPRRARVELRHWRQWRLRQRYYGQTVGGPAYLVVTPTHVEMLPPPQRPPVPCVPLT